MVLRVYMCKKCGKTFEKKESIKTEPLKICEECGGELKQEYGLQTPLIFTHPMRGVVTQRFA